ncbi:hypothetical protein [Natronobeatus ordinarius]|uniref:hypothetical protein n=1 Tax=Natronobeatus ordinarius TaxID=2963433 RepID=UPI0020CCA58D|nr:hypothetical protein [Natronobeatus ordinarius]
MSVAAVDRTEATWSTLLALAILTVVLSVLSGPAGAAVGVATAAIWYAFGTPYALAGGHVALPVLFPDGIGPVALVAVFLAFLGVLVAPVVGTPRPIENAVVVLASVLGLAGITWLAASEGSLPIAAATLLSVVAVVAVAIHRYERVRLGLAWSSTEPETGAVDP